MSEINQEKYLPSPPATPASYTPTFSSESPDKETIHKSICDLQEILSQDLPEEIFTVDNTETEDIESPENNLIRITVEEPSIQENDSTLRIDTNSNQSPRSETKSTVKNESELPGSGSTVSLRSRSNRTRPSTPEAWSPEPDSLFDSDLNHQYLNTATIMADSESGRNPCSGMGSGQGKACKVGFVTIAVISIVLAIVLSNSMHVVEEGHVGVYFRNGALQDDFGMPGLNFKAPFVTTLDQVVVRPETSTLEMITAITRDGISNTFHDIQVISYAPEHMIIPLIKGYGRNFKKALVFDRISEELRTFCANHTIDEVYNTMFLDVAPYVKSKVVSHIETLLNGSINIVNLVVPKPDIPADIAQNYKQVKVQWTQQLVAVQEQKTEEIKKQTELMKALADANREKEVLEVELEKNLLMKEAEKNVSLIKNDITKAEQENLANVEAYKKEKAAEANEKLYTDKYVQLETSKYLSTNTKFYFSGETSPLGALLAKIIPD